MTVQLVDVAYTADELEERQEGAMPLADAPKYPYGLTINLDEKTLEKLKIDSSDWSVGDIFHLHALSKVTSISEHENTDGKCCSVSLQIIALGAESEDAEDEEEEESDPSLEKHGYLRYNNK